MNWNDPPNVIEKRVRTYLREKIDPKLAAEHRTLLTTMDGDARDRILDALVVRVLRISGPHTSRGPCPEKTAAWILGADLRSLAPGLTRREASAYMRQSKHREPLAWYWAGAIERDPELCSSAGEPASLQVAKWAVRLSQSRRREALLTRRDGMAGTGRAIDRLDELTPQDLRESVVETLSLADSRIVNARWSGPDELQPRIECLPGVRHLYRFSDLLREGRLMHHCVVTYADAVYRGRSLIFSLQVGEQRSTLELSPKDLSVVQHVGRANAPPPAACVALVDDLRRDIKEKAQRWSHY